MATFLKLVPIISDLTASMVDMLEERLKQHAQAGTDLIIGPVYLGLFHMTCLLTQSQQTGSPKQACSIHCA